MRNKILALMITAALQLSPAFAQGEIETSLGDYLDADDIVPATEIPIPREADTQTGLWLQLQTSGAIAGSQYEMPGQTATLVYQRYLKSFTHPIPLQFKSGGAGSSGSSGSTARR